MLSNKSLWDRDGCNLIVILPAASVIQQFENLTAETVSHIIDATNNSIQWLMENIILIICI